MSKKKSGSQRAGKTERVLRKDQDEMPEALRDRPIPVSSKDTTEAPAPLPTWYKVLMFGLMIMGLLWVIVYYISQTKAPVAAWEEGNMLAGFGLIAVGFLMMMRWR